MLEMIAARAENGVIGNAGDMPWHIPEDLKHFRTVTTGAAVIMGRKTFESIGRPLPKRLNIVITRQENYAASGCTVVPNLAAALEAARASDRQIIIGGGEIYRQALSLADRLWITEIAASPKGDTTFPELNDADWETMLLSELPAEGERPAVKFLRLDRRHQAGAASA